MAFNAALLSAGTVSGQCACRAQCQGCCLVQVVYTPSVCGNGILEAGEGCDDGDLDGGDGCSATCQVCLSVWQQWTAAGVCMRLPAACRPGKGWSKAALPVTGSCQAVRCGHGRNLFQVLGQLFPMVHDQPHVCLSGRQQCISHVDVHKPLLSCVHQLTRLCAACCRSGLP